MKHDTLVMGVAKSLYHLWLRDIRNKKTTLSHTEYIHEKGNEIQSFLQYNEDMDDIDKIEHVAKMLSGV